LTKEEVGDDVDQQKTWMAVGRIHDQNSPLGALENLCIACFSSRCRRRISLGMDAASSGFLERERPKRKFSKLQSEELALE
jgi:hypothetical protein